MVASQRKGVNTANSEESLKYDLRQAQRILVALGWGKGCLEILVQEVSLLILNVTQIDVTKNKQSIRWLVKNVQVIVQELSNVTKAVMVEMRELSNFVKQYKVVKDHKSTKPNFNILTVVCRACQNASIMTPSVEHCQHHLHLFSKTKNIKSELLH